MSDWLDLIIELVVRLPGWLTDSAASSSTPVDGPSPRVCAPCLWRSADNCTAADSPVSGQRCEPVCSGGLECQDRLEWGQGEELTRSDLSGTQRGSETRPDSALDLNRGAVLSAAEAIPKVRPTAQTDHRQRRSGLLVGVLLLVVLVAVAEITVSQPSTPVRQVRDYEAGKQEPSGGELRNADLHGADLSRADLSGANLTRANLSGALLNGANLRGTDLSEANLDLAALSGADLDEGTLIHPKWRLVWALVNRGDTGRDLRQADLRRANLSGADLSKANLYATHLTGADLSAADLSAANLSTADLSNADLRGANLGKAKLFRANLSEANLSGAQVFKANLSGANLQGAKATAVQLELAEDLTGATMPDGSVHE